MEKLWPKKASVLKMKLKGEDFTYMHFIKVDEQMAFIDFRDKPMIPFMRVLHQFPNMMDRM